MSQDFFEVKQEWSIVFEQLTKSEDKEKSLLYVDHLMHQHLVPEEGEGGQVFYLFVCIHNETT